MELQNRNQKSSFTLRYLLLSSRALRAWKSDRTIEDSLLLDLQLIAKVCGVGLNNPEGAKAESRAEMRRNRIYITFIFCIVNTMLFYVRSMLFQVS